MKNVRRDDAQCPDQSLFRDAAMPGSYFGSIGGLSALWFRGWLNGPVNNRAKGNTRRWKVMGWLQAAQAVLNNDAWPIEDAICALKNAVYQYRAWAKATGRVGEGRDAHDVARYLYGPNVTRDRAPYLRPGLPPAEEKERRAHASKMLRAVQYDMARWLEQISPMTQRAMPLSTAFRVPGLPLDWRSNPFLSEWDDMPFGFTRPSIALSMWAAGIVRFPYAFAKRDPNYRDWPEREDLLDDIVDLVSDAWDWMSDVVDDVSSWICENQELFSTFVTGITVAGECIGTAGAGCGAAASSAPKQYMAVKGLTSSGCAGRAVYKGIGLAFQWDEIVSGISDRVAGQVALASAVAPDLPQRVVSTEEVVEQSVRSAMLYLEQVAKPLIEDELEALRDMVSDLVSSSSEYAIAFRPVTDRLLDEVTVAGELLGAVKKKAVKTVRQIVTARVAHLKKDAKLAGGVKDRVAQQVVRDLENINKASGKKTSRRDSFRRSIMAGRLRGVYGGSPSVTYQIPEETTAVQNAVLAGVPMDEINGILFSRGPSQDAASPTLESNDIKLKLVQATISRLENSGLSSVYIEQEESQQIRAARVALRTALELVARLSHPQMRVTVAMRSGVFVPRNMLGVNIAQSYPPTRDGDPVLSFSGKRAEETYTQIASKDVVAILKPLRNVQRALVSYGPRVSVPSILSVYFSMASAHFGAFIKAVMESSNRQRAVDLRLAKEKGMVEKQRAEERLRRKAASLKQAKERV